MKAISSQIKLATMLDKSLKGTKSLVDSYEAIVPYFNRYLWVLSPHIGASAIKQLYKALKSNQLTAEEFDRIMIESFEKNNFKMIRELIERIEESNRFQKRKEAIIDCLKSIQILEKQSINIAFTILPSLIIQFDGMLTDFAVERNLKYAQGRLYKNKISDDRINAVLTELRKKNPSRDDFNFINTVDRVLFQFNNRNSIAPSLKSFNRHNIIHGEVTDFGQKQHIYRMVALIDALYVLK